MPEKQFIFFLFVLSIRCQKDMNQTCKSTIFQDELFQLVTDQGFLTESNVVWETLSNVEGDCHFVDSEFHTYTKPEPPSIPVDSSNIPLNTDEQIDHE